jgi:hypothetical protein
MTSDRGDYGAKARSFELQADGTDLYAVFQGVRIAKRGAKGTPQARTWISLEPGFRVRDAVANFIQRANPSSTSELQEPRAQEPRRRVSTGSSPTSWASRPG